MKPEWMPPPSWTIDGVKLWDRDAVIAAVEAYKASLKPVAWMHDKCVFSSIDKAKYDDERHRQCGFKGKQIIELYRLDGGDDE
jgi:hypothetical protein